MSKILYYSDLHFRKSGSFSGFNKVVSDCLTGELINILKGCDFIVDKILQEAPDLVVDGGDFFHSPEYVSSQTIYAATIALKKIRNACNEVGAIWLGIAGNHDTYSEIGNRVTSNAFLDGYMDKLYLSGDFYDLDGFGIYLFPHMSNDESVMLNLMKGEDEADLIITHLDFNGFKYDSGKVSESQILPVITKPCHTGHLHRASEKDNVAYIASNVQHRFYSRNLDQVGGVMLYDTAKDKITRHKNTYSKHYIIADLDEDGDFFSKYSPEQVVVSASGFGDQSDYKQLADYQHIYFKKPLQNKEERNVSDMQPIYMDQGDMTETLGKYVSDNNPRAFSRLKNILRM